MKYLVRKMGSAMKNYTSLRPPVYGFDRAKLMAMLNSAGNNQGKYFASQISPLSVPWKFMALSVRIFIK